MAKGTQDIQSFRDQVESRLGSFAEALPSHITPQRFRSIIMQAVTSDPNLLAADRVSLFESCLAAANDGLLPNKKEGALVVYKTKIKDGGKDVWVDKVQWLPMILGVILKVQQTGKVKSVNMDVVYGGDSFRYWTDDTGQHIEHIPAENRDKTVWRRVYAQVVMNDESGGGVFLEVLDAADIEKIRKTSKSAGSDYSPWSVWFDEMAKKSAMKRLAKRLPFSRELEQVLSRDDFLHQIDLQASAPGRVARQPLAAALEDLTRRDNRMPMARTEARENEVVDHRTGEVEERKQTDKKKENPPSGQKVSRDANDGGNTSSAREQGDGKAAGSKDGESGSAAEKSQSDDPGKDAFLAGKAARAKNMSRKATPPEYRDSPELLEAYLEGFDASGD